MKNKPLVSICCITYNHEDYIADAIESFLMQEANFPLEIIIHDDASTDRTAKIIREYEEKHPDLIKPIYQEENQFSQGNTPIFANFVFPKAKGKYIALCEGDDYWTDPLKLQKQVAFLEAHPDYIMSFHDARIINEDGEELTESKLQYSFRKKDYTKKEVVRGPLMPTMSVVFRNKTLQQYASDMRNIVNGDRFLFSMLGQYGKAHYANEVKSAVYRAHKGGVWSDKSVLSQKEDGIRTYEVLLESIDDEFKPTIRSELIYRLLSLSAQYLKSGNYVKFSDSLHRINQLIKVDWINVKHLLKNLMFKGWQKLIKFN